MAKSISTFALVAVLTGVLMALSIALARHGYAFGAIGARRLDGLASAASFVPLAALYFLINGGGIYSLDHLIGWEF